MIINSKYIYISFTSFTMMLINILFVCKYCKYAQTTDNLLKFKSIAAKNGKIHIYMDVMVKILIFRFIQIFIYNIYNIYRLLYTPKLHQKIKT